MKKIALFTLIVLLTFLFAISFTSCDMFVKDSEHNNTSTENNQVNNTQEGGTEDYFVINLSAFQMDYFDLPAINVCYYSNDKLVKEEFFTIPNSSTEYGYYMFDYRYENGTLNEIFVACKNDYIVASATFESSGNNTYTSTSENIPAEIKLSYHENKALKSRTLSFGEGFWCLEYNERGQLIKDSQNDNSIEFMYSDTSKFADRCKITFDNTTNEFALTTNENGLESFNIENTATFSFDYNNTKREMRMELQYTLDDSGESFSESMLFADNNGEMVMKEFSGCSYVNNILTEQVKYKYLYEKKNEKSILIVTSTYEQSNHKYSKETIDENGEYVTVYFEHRCYTHKRTTYEMNELGQWIDVTPSEEVFEEMLDENSYMRTEYIDGELSYATVIVIEESNELDLPTKYTQYDYENSLGQDCFADNPSAIFLHRATYDENSRCTELYTTDIDENTTRTTYSYSVDEYGHDVIVSITEKNGEFEQKLTVSYSEDGKYTIETLEKIAYLHDAELGGFIESGVFSTVTTKDSNGTIIDVKYYLNGEEFTPQQPPIEIIPPSDDGVTVIPVG